MSTTQPALEPACLTAALDYAQRGWHVLPLKPRGKLPATEHGFKDATTGSEQIRRWWERDPAYNLGIRTGAESGLVVIDIDPRHGGDVSWREWLAHQTLDDCLVMASIASVKSGGDGWHLYFRHPGGDLGSRNRILPGLDLKADGGLIVAPPSVHPDTGAYYAWENHPDAFPLAEMPEALLRLVRSPAARVAKPAGEDDGVMPEGERNETLFRKACRFRRGGLSEADVLSAIQGINECRCESPLPEDEVTRLVRSAVKTVDKDEEEEELARCGLAAPSSLPDPPEEPEMPQEEWQRIFGDRSGAGRDLSDNDVRIPHLRTSLLPAQELLSSTFPEPVWGVPGYLPAGLTFLAGKPKVGKSWLGLQLAYAIGAGGMALGKRVEPGTVLYYALEDHERRIKARMRAQRWESPGRVEVGFALGPLVGKDPSGLDTLRQEVERLRPKLVVIDTVARLLPADTKTDHSATMTAALGPLQRLALDYECCIVLIDHHRKGQGGQDSIEDLMGSISKGGVADCVWGLYRERGKREAKLRMVGRDLEEDHELAVTFDDVTCCWQPAGGAPRATSTVAAKVRAALQAAPEQTATNGRIEDATGLDKGLVSRTLADLEEAGEVERLPKDGTRQPWRLVNLVNESTINKANVDLVDQG